MSEESILKIRKTFEESIVTKQAVLDKDLYQMLASAGDTITNSIKNGGKLMICGNGGSAADSQHLAAEFLIRLTSDVNRQGIPAISLVQDSSTLTACINDYGPDDIFKRVLLTLGQEADVLLAITTSGNSNNIIETLKSAREKNIYTIGFLGNGGGKALKLCDSAFVVPSKVTARIQESHITAGHAMLQYVEDELLRIGHLEKN
jgi:D-sedoheptulose 7-phosphate isomerase|tara:strand:+ start:318 stop:929 length:612 start_codon:yes stop_codon:yes gene_type:complete